MAKNELELPLERKLFFSKQVDQDSINNLTQKIIEINEHDQYLSKLYSLHDLQYKPKPIRIYIDSYGGYVYQIRSAISVIQLSKTEVHTIATGAAMSCGFLLLISGHKRFALPYATPMYHQVSSGTIGKVQDIEEDLEETKRLQRWIEELTFKTTKITKKQLKENKKRKIDWYFNKNEMLKFGIVDEILDSI